MIDDNFKVWLIEVNTNPCLELSSPLLSKIIPAMVENSLRIAVDTVFVPPLEHMILNKKQVIFDNALDFNKYDLVFDENVDGLRLKQMMCS